MIDLAACLLTLTLQGVPALELSLTERARAFHVELRLPDWIELELDGGRALGDWWSGRLVGLDMHPLDVLVKDDGELVKVAGLFLVADWPVDPSSQEFAAHRFVYPLAALPDLLAALRVQMRALCARGHDIFSLCISSADPTADPPYATVTWWLDPDERGRASKSLSGRVDLPVRHQRELDLHGRGHGADHLVGGTLLRDRSFDAALLGLDRTMAVMDLGSGARLDFQESNRMPGAYWIRGGSYCGSPGRDLEVLVRTGTGEEALVQAEDRGLSVAGLRELLHRVWSPEYELAGLAVGTADGLGFVRVCAVTLPAGSSSWPPEGTAQLHEFFVSPEGGLQKADETPLEVIGRRSDASEYRWLARLPDELLLTLSKPRHEECTYRQLAPNGALHLAGERLPLIAGWALSWPDH